MRKGPTGHIDKKFFFNISIQYVIKERDEVGFFLNWWDLSFKETAEDLVSIHQNQSLSKFHDYS